MDDDCASVRLGTHFLVAFNVGRDLVFRIVRNDGTGFQVEKIFSAGDKEGLRAVDRIVSLFYDPRIIGGARVVVRERVENLFRENHLRFHDIDQFF